MPQELADWIAQTFPGFRLPVRADQKAAWSSQSSSVAPPYLAKGDFNGDGRMDYAVVVLSETSWRLIIAHGAERSSGTSFHIGLVWSGNTPVAERPFVNQPQDLLLRAIPRDEEWAPEGGDVPQDLSHPYDALQLIAYRKTEIGDTFAEPALIWWDGEHYRGYGQLEGMTLDEVKR